MDWIPVGATVDSGSVASVHKTSKAREIKDIHESLFITNIQIEIFAKPEFNRVFVL